jgi:hypothetical protein
MKIQLAIPRHMNDKDVIFTLTDELTTAGQIKDRTARLSAIMGVCKIIQELSDGLRGTYQAGVKIVVDSGLPPSSSFSVEEYSGTDYIYKSELATDQGRPEASGATRSHMNLRKRKVTPYSRR